MLGLRSPSARAALPRVPITKQLELLVEAGFFHENLEFHARKAFPEWFGAVRDSPGRQRGEHGMQLQFAHIDLVQRVRSGMIIRQIVGLFLICYQRRHAFEHEVKIVRTERGVIGVIVRAPGFQRLERFSYARFDVAATTQRIPRDAADPRVVGDHRADFVELRVVRLYLLERSNRTLFLAAEVHESYWPPRHTPRCTN